MEEWVSLTRAALKGLRHRPRTLLVIINPYGGARKAHRVWTRIAQPVLHLTGLPHLAGSGYQCRFALRWRRHRLGMCRTVPPGETVVPEVSRMFVHARMRRDTQTCARGAALCPVSCAGAYCHVRDTLHEKHAVKMVTDLTLADLERYDGIVAVSPPWPCRTARSTSVVGGLLIAGRMPFHINLYMGMSA